MENTRKSKRHHASHWRNPNTTQRGRIKYRKNRVKLSDRNPFPSKYYKSKRERIEQLEKSESILVFQKVI